MRNLLRSLAHLRGSGVLINLCLVLLVLATAANLVQPGILERAVDEGLTSAAGSGRALWYAGVMALVATGGALAYFGSGAAAIRAGNHMAERLNVAVMQRIADFSFPELDSYRVGELLNRAGSDVNTIRLFVRVGLLMLLQSIATLAGALIAVYRLDPSLARILGIGLPISLAVFLAIAVGLRPFYRLIREKLDRVNVVLQENLAGYRLVRAFSRQEHEIARFNAANKDFLTLSVRIGVFSSALFPLLALIGQLIVLLVTWQGGLSIIDARIAGASAPISLGRLLAFGNFALLAMWPILALGMTLNFIAMAVASADRVMELLDTKPAIQGGNYRPRAASPVSGAVEFLGVSFGFAGGSDVLRDISLRVEPGERVGIIGPTASGKSSLAHCIPRYVEPRTGSILLDGTPIRDWDLRTLRDAAGVVLQEPVLISGSLRDNLLLGNPGATESEMLEALEIADARSFVSDREDGLDAIVGQRGLGLSGGERQRIALARAVLASRPVLILDDVTSALDAATEQRVLDRLFARRSGRTTLVISHRISTMRRMDRVLVLAEGRIEAFARPAELDGRSPTWNEIGATQADSLGAIR